MNLIDQHSSGDAQIIRCHHFGLAVHSIVQSAERIAQSLGGSWNGDIVEDELQQVKVSFIEIKDSPLLELVEPLNDLSPIKGFLDKGVSLYHICYEVSSMELAISHQISAGNLLISQAKPAVAFGGRKIAWIYTKDGLIIELLESENFE